jgi:hypothetical protein
MAHFAKLDESNIVTNVIVINNNELLENGLESEAKGIALCESLFGGRWIQTSYNGTIRKNFASIGMLYDPINDWFYIPQPYASWTLDSNAQWQAPIARPLKGLCDWNEDLGAWVEAEII